ncbi:MAG: hypothetical protein Unbinned3972contig1001_8 [Prokaryotic dsDNA virus sp.]|nr:MAG: hypothetical protein Unbinned3972contig1001_8 [Prokaryotic dsDNA virus sp.]|tara:strand:- start:35399 stop:36031 length:633 start_codon:yes stop_codon:yes gene_type:complete
MSANEAKEARLDAARAALDDEAKKKTPRVNPGFDVGQEAFMQEMEAAEARGDLPPVTVRTPENMGNWDQFINDAEPEIIRSMEGGETPTEAAKTYRTTLTRMADARKGAQNRLRQLSDQIAPKTIGYVGRSDLSTMFELIADGKVTLNDPELQKEVLEAATEVKKLYANEDNPQGYIPQLHDDMVESAAEESVWKEGKGVMQAVHKGELE